MGQTTEKLGLYLPEYTDEIEYFTNGLKENFEKLDIDSKDYSEQRPTIGLHEKGMIVYDSNPQIDGYVGWINLRTGIAAPDWKQLQKTNIGDTILPKQNNGHYYTCIQSGYTGITEPIFPVSNGGEVSDIRGGNTWKTNHFYTLNNVAFPTVDNGRFYVCIQEGESGNIEPAWSNVDGATTYDNNAVWHGYRIARWKESGVAAFYRPFGKID